MSLLLLLATSPAFAYSAGRTSSSTTGCGACHGATASASTTATLAASDTVVAPGEAVTLTMVVANSGASYTGAGLDVSVSGGTLRAGSNTRVSASEVTHSATTSMSAGSVTFNFAWTAPTAEGTYTLRGAGNAVNNNRSDSGDAWALASNLTLTVDDGCDDLDGDGVEACDDGTGDDCDDDDRGVFPGAAETCDGVDEDCDGTVDESPTDGTAYWPDDDGDGYGDDDAMTRSCTVLAGHLTVAGDCDDTNFDIRPGSFEVCDGVDQDCDGAIDGPDSVDVEAFYRDADADGYGDESISLHECSAPAGYVVYGGDCDDTRGGVNPDAAEVCDALDLDEDCDTRADDADSGVTGTSTFYADADADGYGGDATVARCSLPSGYTSVPGDCDDGDNRYNPGAREVCDEAVDYNCDGSAGTEDNDGDGVSACEDCNDANPDISPSGAESCNTVDDDCDGTVDEADAIDAATWYLDADTDGWGSAGDTSRACTQPDGYTDDALDCDDASADVRPDAPEVWYDAVDQDCDGNDDDQDGDGHPAATDCDDVLASTFPGAPDAWYDGVDADCAANSDFDQDVDGQDSASHGGTDCDDADPAVYTGAPDEPYDGVVTDCVDADEYDVDGDGHAVDVDCDDASSAVNPDAAEVWYDGIDQDCDGNDADQDGDGLVAEEDCDDTDAAVTDCDTGDTGEPIEEDTGVEQDKGRHGCGCSTSSPAAGLALGLLALGAVVRRRPPTA
jgi:MYXO-CTERM domain-containing protein